MAAVACLSHMHDYDLDSLCLNFAPLRPTVDLGFYVTTLAYDKLKVTIVPPSPNCGVKPLCFTRSPWISAQAGRMLSELKALPSCHYR